MNRSHSKRNLWTAAAVGALIIGTSSAALAQSAPDSSVSRSAVGLDAKMAAIIDSLKADGAATQQARGNLAVGQAGINALQAQEQQREQANFEAGQAGLAAQAAANANTGATSAVPNGTTGNAQLDAVIGALKADGLATQKAQSNLAIGQAGIDAMQAQEQQREQANFEAGQAALAAQAAANGNASSTPPASAPTPGAQQSGLVDALKADGLATQNARNNLAVGQAGINAMQAQEQAREQANFQAGEAGLAAQAAANGGASSTPLASAPTPGAQQSGLVDALKANGLATQNARNNLAIGQAGINAMQAQEQAREQTNFQVGQTMLTALSAKNATTPSSSVAPEATTTNGQVSATADALKADGITTENARATLAAGQAQMSAEQAEEQARENGNLAAGLAGLSAEAAAGGSSSTDPSSSTATSASADGSASTGGAASAGGGVSHGSQRNRGG
jgi:trimeric autotransporter adhesin